MGPARFIVHRRGTVLGLAAIATLLLGFVGAHLKFDFTPQAIYVGDGDLIEYAEAFRDVFGHDDAVLLVVVEGAEGVEIASAEGLAWSRTFAGSARDIEHVVRVDALGELPFPGLPLVRRAFVSEDGRWMQVAVHVDPEARDVASVTAVVAGVEKALEAAPPPHGATTRLGGLPAMRAEVVADLKREQLTRMPLAGIVFFVVLLAAYRRLAMALLPLVAVGTGLVWTAGSLVVGGHALNIISNILPVLLFTIGTSNCIHVLNRYTEAYDRVHDRKAAALATIKPMSLACLLTYLTTAIGFLSLLAARADVLRQVGWETAVGLALLYVATVAVLGALLPSARPAPPASRTGRRLFLARVTAAAGYVVARHPWPVLLGSLVLVALALAGASNLRVNCRLLETYEDDHPAAETMRILETKLGGALVLDVDVRTDVEDGLRTPEAQKAIAAIAEAARAERDVLEVRAWTDVTKALGPALARRLGATGGADRYITRDGRRSRVEVRVRDAGSARLLALSERLDREARRRFPPDGPVRVRLTGDAYVYATAMDHLIRDLLVSLLGAAVVIFAVIALLFRSLRYGLISALPNLTPLVLTLGYMHVRGYELTAASAIVFAISLGVAVDNTIHFLARYREELRVDGDVLEAVHRTLYGAGRPMVLTSILVVLGLAVLHLSEFVPTRQFAELTSITMAAALLGDLLLLPACLRLFGPGAAGGMLRRRRR